MHVIGALLVLTLLGVGLCLDDMPKGAIKSWAFSLHKAVGFVTLGWMIVWWADFVTQIKPLPPQGSSLGQHRLAVAVKWVLLTGGTLMPLSGWLMAAASGRTEVKTLGVSLPNPFLFKVKKLSGFFWDIHENVANILIAAIALHIAGALYHHFIRRDNVLTRMFPFIRAPK